jgi:cellulose synthase/poly-beta-1,6-N-acetylglucosamine synthase-like glycosyltransferase
MLDNIFLALFIISSALLWISTFGYISVLRLLELTKKPPPKSSQQHPEIAVVIPTLNEAHSIREKIKDIELSEYSKDQIKIIVVDGGSTDRTVKIVEHEISCGKKIQLICMNGTPSKVNQVNHVLSNSAEEIIIFTDADSRLDPSSIRELVHTITSDSETALVGATVKPKSTLLEEQVHWGVLNTIWWLEGEVFSSAGISGVCYALNRNMFRSIAPSAIAEDIHLGLDISARGYRVRICPKAVAYELRVPQTAREFVNFRRRRGVSYVNELVHSPTHTDPPLGWKIVRFIRLWQFTWIAWLGLATVITGCLLLMTPHWPFLFLALLVFIFSVLFLVFSVRKNLEEKPGYMRLLFAICRYPILILVSLLTFKKITSPMGPIGGKEENFDKTPAV